MTVYVVIGLYQGLVDRIGVFQDQTKAEKSALDMKEEGLEVSGPHKEIIE